MALIAAGALAASVSGPATWATTMDLGGPRAAVLAGVMNMLGNVGAYLCPKQIGQLFNHIEVTEGSWDLVLWVFAGVNLVGGAAWLLVNPSAGSRLDPGEPKTAP